MNGTPRLQATSDALRRRNPHLLADLSRRFPDFGLTVTPTRPRGGEDTPASTPSRDINVLATTLVEEARRDVSEMSDILAVRSKRIATIRLLTGVASALASASVVALILGEQKGQVVAGIVALFVSVSGVVVTYIEEFSGGAGSTAKMREAVMHQVRLLASAEAKIRVGVATVDQAAVLSAIGSLNEVFGEIQALRSQLGLKI